MNIYHYDAFSQKPDKGNPAGVVLEAETLSEYEMQKIAAAVGFNETVFICSSEKADYKFRYFTPGHEMNLCGHGTVASLVALSHKKSFKDICRIETKAGIIDMTMKKSDTGNTRVIMKQLPARFIEFKGETDKLARAIGLKETDIETKWPIVYGNTGIWTLLVPIKKLLTFQKMIPKTQEFPDILSQFNRSSIHPFCLETHNPEAHMHGRHFSSPFSGTIEDPVTGTASGVMGAYYLNYISGKKSASLLVEQGQEINKDGRVTVNVKKSDEFIDVEIEGTAIYVKEIDINLTTTKHN